MIASSNPSSCPDAKAGMVHAPHEWYGGGWYRTPCPGWPLEERGEDDAYARGVAEGRRQAAEAIKGYTEEGAVIDLGDGYSEITPRLGAWTWIEVLGVRVMVDRHEGRTVLRWKRLVPGVSDVG